MPGLKSLALVALGGNQPLDGKEPAEVLHDAVAALARAGLDPVALSRFYSTPCFPAGAGPDYVNAAVALQTDLDAADLLSALHAIEAQFGRERTGRWAGRTLDLDLLALDGTVAPDRQTWARWHDLTPAEQRSMAPNQLILPHPRLQDRAFVLVPLADVAPDWRHPILGQTVLDMLSALPHGEIDAIRPI